MYVYICIYDKRQREIEIEKTNEQKRGVQEKMMMMMMMIRARSALTERERKNKTFYVFLFVFSNSDSSSSFFLRTITIVQTRCCWIIRVNSIADQVIGIGRRLGWILGPTRCWYEICSWGHCGRSLWLRRTRPLARCCRWRFEFVSKGNYRWIDVEWIHPSIIRYWNARSKRRGTARRERVAYDLWASLYYSMCNCFSLESGRIDLMGTVDLEQVVVDQEDNLDVCLSVMDIAGELARHSTWVALQFHLKKVNEVAKRSKSKFTEWRRWKSLLLLL